MTGGTFTYEVSVTYDDERQCNLRPSTSWNPVVHKPHVWDTDDGYGGWAPPKPRYLCNGVDGFELPKRHSWHLVNRVPCSICRPGRA